MRLDAIILFEAGDENEKIEFYRYAVFNIFVLSRSIRTILVPRKVQTKFQKATLALR